MKEKSLFQYVIIIVGIFFFAFFLREFSFNKIEVASLLFLLLFLFKLPDFEFKSEITNIRVTFSASTVILFASLFILPLYHLLAIAVLSTLLVKLARKKQINWGEIIYLVSSLTITLSLSWIFYNFIINLPFLRSYPLLGYILTGLLYFALEISLMEPELLTKGYLPFLPVIYDLSLLTWQSYFSHFFLGILVVTLFKKIHFWSFPFFFIALGIQYFLWSLYSTKENYEKLIKLVVKVIGKRKSQFLAHAERVHDLSLELGRLFKLKGKDFENLGKAAFLHDLGKIGVDEYSLDFLLESSTSKEGDLLHATIGEEILQKTPFLKDTAEIVRKHHKPFLHHKKKPQEMGTIPLSARIINVVSTYDNMVFEEGEGRLRPEEAIRSLKKEQGIIYDPKIIRFLARLLEARGILQRKKRHHPTY